MSEMLTALKELVMAMSGCDVCKKIKAMGEFKRGFMKISYLDDIYTLEGEDCNECGNFIFPIKKTN